MNKDEIIELINNKHDFWKEELSREYERNGNSPRYFYCSGYVVALGYLIERIQNEMEGKE